MKMIRHGENQADMNFTLGFAKQQGFENGFPNEILSELSGSTFRAADGDEEDFTFRIRGDVRRNLVRKILSSDRFVHRGDWGD